jgi:anti-sigma-K factor RskA
MADEDFDALAAEYALGTLSEDERAEADRLAARDAEFAGRIAAWERRLGTLEAMVDPVEPPAEVWDHICTRMAETVPDAALRLPEVATAAPARDVEASNVAILRRRVRRWRGVAALTGAMAAALLLVIGIGRYRPELLPPQLQPPVQTQIVERVVERERIVQAPPPPAPPPQPAPGRFVAVLQRDTGTPAFLITVDINNRSLTVRRVAPTPEPGKSHELWLVSDRFPAPHSLGLVGAGEFTQRTALTAYDPDTIHNATFAISLEPEGGSPTGSPTGLVLFTGKLLEAMPPAPQP